MAVVISVLIVLSLVGEAIAFITQVDFRKPRVGGSGSRAQGTTTCPRSSPGRSSSPSSRWSSRRRSDWARRSSWPSTRRHGVRRTVKPILEVLAAIPSVVLGFFALTVLSPTVIDRVCPGSTPLFNMAAAGVAVGILITPLVASIAEDAMYAVPSSLREASYGLGARKRITSLRVVFPAAISGIVAALIVGFSRAIGETMIVALVAGGVGGAVFNLNPCLPGQTMTAAMTALAIGSDQAGGGIAYASLFFVGLLLFAMTLSLNLISERLRAPHPGGVLMAIARPLRTTATTSAVVRARPHGSAPTVGRVRLPGFPVPVAHRRPRHSCSGSCRTFSSRSMPVWTERGAARLRHVEPVVRPGTGGHRSGSLRLAAADGHRHRG